MAGWMRPTRSYIPPVEIGAVFRAAALGRIADSKSSKFQKGQLITATTGMTEWIIMNEKDDIRVLPKLQGVEDYAHLSTLGLTGLTAYFGTLEIAKVKAGDTFVVSGAAGATGSVAGQIAKLKGARVIGIAGSEDKCKWLTDDLGFDVALNYKSKNFRKELKAATPKYINCYFDNVGGWILDEVMGRLAKYARIALCGAISGYNASGQPYGLKVYPALIAQHATLQGFIVFNFTKRYPEAYKDLAQWVLEGKIKRNAYFLDGMESCVTGLIDLFEGKNTGKIIVRVGDPSAKL